MKEIVYELNSLYRDNLRVTGYRFGGGEKTLCIIGTLRGNEIQQLYICSQLIRRLKEMQSRGLISKEKSVLVIPCINSASLNIGKRFWPTDNTDINRMFPGYSRGETTQRIAAGVFEQIKDYEYGIQFASYYMPGQFIPHVRITETGFEDVEEAKHFGLPYIITKKPKPYDTTTLNYNWQIWDCKAFSLYTSETDRIDKKSAYESIAAVFRFMEEKGICTYRGHKGSNSEVVEESALRRLKSSKAGLLDYKVEVNQMVRKNELLAEIYDPYEGSVLEEIRAINEGIVFYINNNPMVNSHTVIFKILEESFK
ncbi:MAG: M14 family metallopeptidase [bacterium]|nr:M14 family metallopeptidase [bacterium]